MLTDPISFGRLKFLFLLLAVYSDELKLLVGDSFADFNNFLKNQLKKLIAEIVIETGHRINNLDMTHFEQASKTLLETASEKKLYSKIELLAKLMAQINEYSSTIENNTAEKTPSDTAPDTNTSDTSDINTANLSFVTICNLFSASFGLHQTEILGNISRDLFLKLDCALLLEDENIIKKSLITIMKNDINRDLLKFIDHFSPCQKSTFAYIADFCITKVDNVLDRLS